MLFAACRRQLEQRLACGCVQSQFQQHAQQHEQQQWCAGCPTSAQSRPEEVLTRISRDVLKGGSLSVSLLTQNKRGGRF